MAEAETLDELIRGRIRVFQPRAGYRVNLDSILLVYFTGEPPYGRVVDLGAGVGVIGLALAVRDVHARVVLAELQPSMAAFARRNVVENGLAERAQVVEVDLSDLRASRAVLPGASFDQVVSSPPYFPVSAGPKVQAESEAIARHEVRLTVEALAKAARRLLVPGGRASIVYPADRLGSLLSALSSSGIEPKRLRPIYPSVGPSTRRDVEANRVLVEAHKGGRPGLRFEAPLYVRDESGAYTAEARIALGEIG